MNKTTTAIKEVKPFISASKNLHEITFRGVMLGIILAMVLGGANAYLGLKLGSTITGCIPAAVISMVLLRHFKNSNILENNMVQTIASAGETLAAGLVFTLPALISIKYWSEFNILQTTIIGVVGGTLGVLFSVPLRRTFIVQSKLSYPEGIATAEVLKSGEVGATGIRELMFGGIISAIFKFMQTGLGICTDVVHKWFTVGGTTFGMGTGLSMAMIGSGYVIGYKACIAMFIGSGITWVVGIPLYTTIFGSPEGKFGFEAATAIWATKMRYVGVGAFIAGGIWTAISIAKPIQQAIRASLESLRESRMGRASSQLRTEKDMPMNWVIMGTILFSIPVFIICHYALSSMNFGLSTGLFWTTLIIGTISTLIIGFLCSCISSYMAGVVGSSHNPISGVTIMGVILISTILYILLESSIDFERKEIGIAVTAMIMMLTAVTCCASVIAGDNLQDLKTGQIVGATPWKQQAMLIVGVVAGAIAIAPILQILYEAYGFSDSLPRAGMNPATALASPKASLMSDIIKSVFTKTINWTLYGVGAVIAICIIFVDNHLKSKKSSFKLPVLAVAIGIYLPYDVTTAALLGGFISFLVERNITKTRKGLSDAEAEKRAHTVGHKGLLYAAGLIAGEALIAVILAIPFAIYQTTSLFYVQGLSSNQFLKMVLAGSLVFLFSYHFYKTTTALSKKEK